MLYYFHPNVILLLMGCFITFIQIWYYFDSDRLVLRLESNITSPGRFNQFHGDPRLLWLDAYRVSWTERFNIPRALLCVRDVATGRTIAEAWNTFPSFEVFPRLLQLLLGLVPGFLPCLLT